jgi:hypothetical protein
MDKFLDWFASSPLASFLRVFAAIVLAQAVNDFVKLGHLEFVNLEQWVIVGLSAAVPTLLRWLNPADSLGS